MVAQRVPEHSLDMALHPLLPSAPLDAPRAPTLSHVHWGVFIRLCCFHIHVLSLISQLQQRCRRRVFCSSSLGAGNATRLVSTLVKAVVGAAVCSCTSGRGADCRCGRCGRVGKEQVQQAEAEVQTLPALQAVACP